MSTATALATSKGLPELTEAEAREYDHIILIDRSGSMGGASTTMEGRSRWEEAEEFTTAYARFAEKVDDDGLTLITFNSRADVFDGVTSDKVAQIFSQHGPSGSTNLAAALEAAFTKKFASTKPAIVLVMTDGQPDSKEAVKKCITAAANKLEKDADLGIQFIQIGNDKEAAKFLAELDDDLKGAKFDIVNSLTREQAEGMTIQQLLWQALND